MERELRRIECRTDCGEPAIVVEMQFFDIRKTAAGVREYPGARRFAIAGGGALRLIDARTFEVVDTGALLYLIDADDDRVS